MKQIIRPAQYVNLMYNLRRQSLSKYRWLKYCVRLKVLEGELVYNAMTKELLLLEDGDIENEAIQKYLKWGMFWVANNNDDAAMVQNLREFVRAIHKQQKKGYEKYTIFTTTDCNARCYYCFERKWHPVNMTSETAYKIARFIVEDYRKYNNDDKKPVRIDWFGGEPLMNTKVIDIICDYLMKNNILFSCNMTTNGYLFTESLAKKAKENWNLNRVQITIDGPENTYNKIKAYVNIKDNESPYQRVIANIDTLSNMGIKVKIRINLSQTNIKKQEELAFSLADKFAGKDKIMVYGFCLFEDCAAYTHTYTEKLRAELYKMEKNYNRLLDSLGLDSKGKTFRLRRKIKINKCKANNDRMLTINPRGQFSKCEHYIDGDYVIGHIDDPYNINNQRKDQSQEEYALFEKCTDCIHFPDCIRLKICGIDKVCYPGVKETWKEETIKSMKLEYNEWIQANK